VCQRWDLCLATGATYRRMAHVVGPCNFCKHFGSDILRKRKRSRREHVKRKTNILKDRDAEDTTTTKPPPKDPSPI
jgi:hypothetical protein